MWYHKGTSYNITLLFVAVVEEIVCHGYQRLCAPSGLCKGCLPVRRHRVYAALLHSVAGRQAIEEVLSFRPASAMHSSCHGDCYTVRIRGEEKRLFFERTDPRFAGCLGRWFVEKDAE